MMQTVNRGMLISIEGIDGSGKSTLITALAQTLLSLSLPIVVTKEPGATPLGKHLRTLLQERSFALCPKAEFLLFAADRAQHFDELIIPHLQANNIVISDRMADSSLVYQGYGRGLDKDMIHTVNAWAMNNHKPDLTLYIRITPEIAYNRLRSRQSLTVFEQEKEDFYHRLVDGFDTIFTTRNNVVTLDGTLSPAMLAQQAVTAITNALAKHTITE